MNAGQTSDDDIDSDGDDDSDGDSGDEGPGPFHSTAIDESDFNLHLSDDTINLNNPQQSTSSMFYTNRQRKQTNSTGVNNSDTSMSPKKNSDTGGSYQFGGRQAQMGTFGTSASGSNTASTGASFESDGIFPKPQTSADSRDRSARASRNNSRQTSPSRNTPQRSRQGSPVPGTSQQRKRRSRSRINLREELSAKFSGIMKKFHHSLSFVTTQKPQILKG